MKTPCPHLLSVTLVLLVLALTACGESAPTASGTATVDETETATPDDRSGPEKMWVTAERIDRHTCPSKSCGIVGTLDFRHAASVEESKDGWARITRVYDASCSNGRSDYVDKGNADCTPDNGIVDGRFAEWIELRFLAATRPQDPAETAVADEQLVKDSDDFHRYRRAFASAARKLIDHAECTAVDLKENGGFMKSVNNRDAPVYFTYCGGYTVANRIYLNARTGEIYR